MLRQLGDDVVQKRVTFARVVNPTACSRIKSSELHGSIYELAISIGFFYDEPGQGRDNPCPDKD